MVDAKHVGIEGVSRYGKAALVTLAFEERFAMALVGSSGEGARNFTAAILAKPWKALPAAGNTIGWRVIS